MATLLLIFTYLSHGNSCCGQTPSSFPVLYQQESVLISASLAQSQSLGRIYNDPNAFYVWNSDKKRTLSAFNVAVGTTFTEHHQIFLNTAMMRGQWQDAEGKAYKDHLADSQLGYSYELLPEYTYSPWKPVVFVSALMNLPTGKSIYDVNELSEGADVTGANQWGTGGGVTARKVLFPFTLVLQGKYLRLLPKSFAAADVGASDDVAASGFMTYAQRDWDMTFTAGITWSYLSSREIKNRGLSSEPTESCNVILSLQKIIGRRYSMGLSYSDQSLVGRARNTLINQTYSMNFNYFLH